MNHCAAQLDPFEHLKTLWYFEQIRGFDNTGPSRNEPQSTRRQFLHDRIEASVVVVIHREQRDQRSGINQTTSH